MPKGAKLQIIAEGKGRGPAIVQFCTSSTPPSLLHGIRIPMSYIAIRVKRIQISLDPGPKTFQDLKSPDVLSIIVEKNNSTTPVRCSARLRSSLAPRSACHHQWPRIEASSLSGLTKALQSSQAGNRFALGAVRVWSVHGEGPFSERPSYGIQVGLVVFRTALSIVSSPVGFVYRA